MKINAEITYDSLARAMCVLMVEGMDEEQAQVVLQAIGYTLLDAELFPYDDSFDDEELNKRIDELKLQRLVELCEEDVNKLEHRDIVYDKYGNEIVIDEVYCDGDFDCLVAQDVNGNHYFVGDLYWLT